VNPVDFMGDGPPGLHEMLILMAMATEATDKGLVPLNVMFVAERTRIPEPAVKRYVRKLTDEGWLAPVSPGVFQMKPPIPLTARAGARDSLSKTYIYTGTHITLGSVDRDANGKPIEVPYVKREITEDQRTVNRLGIQYARECLDAKKAQDAIQEQSP
jgi:hypothetical protein